MSYQFRLSFFLCVSFIRAILSQVLSIGHASRASGHRFRVNDITCHPVLPLLVTTSHHNLPESGSQCQNADSNENVSNRSNSNKTTSKDISLTVSTSKNDDALFCY